MRPVKTDIALNIVMRNKNKKQDEKRGYTAELKTSKKKKMKKKFYKEFTKQIETIAEKQ